MSEYIYAEPDEDVRTVFLDNQERPHLSREDAIAASIRNDMERHLREQMARAWPDDHSERAFIAGAIVSQIASPHNRELRQMVRDLIEATD